MGSTKRSRVQRTHSSPGVSRERPRPGVNPRTDRGFTPVTMPSGHRVYSSRFGEPLPGLVTTFGVAAAFNAEATWAGV